MTMQTRFEAPAGDRPACRAVPRAAVASALATCLAAPLCGAHAAAPPQVPQALRGWDVASEVFHTQVQVGPVVVYNMTRSGRLYATNTCGNIGPGSSYQCYTGQPFALPAGKLCSLDNIVYPGNVWRSNGFVFDPGTANYVEDETDGPNGSFNGPWITGNDNFDSCANEGSDTCAGGRWGSWMVGLMPSAAVGARHGVTMDEGVEVWVENRWASGNAIDYTNDWVETPIALIMTHGSTDGKAFDIRNNNGWKLPTLRQVFSAPLCASFVDMPS
jgi:hypothetical protein